MSIPIHVVDAFTDEPFKGNAAGVVLLDGGFPGAGWMQSLAAEMRHAETAFIVARSRPGHYDLRWFAPAAEVDLCGHATLASAHVLIEQGAAAAITFHTKSGELVCGKDGGLLTLDFPPLPAEPAEPPAALLPSLGLSSTRHVGRSRFDYLVEVASEEAVRAIHPDFARLATLDCRGVIVCAVSSDPRYDIVSRFFAPHVGVDEDPVTGSSHCTLAPYFAPRLGTTELVALQMSQRTGVVRTALRGERVILKGHAVTILSGQLRVNPIG